MTRPAESDETAVYRFRVEGVEQQRTYLPTAPQPFDETFEIEGEHPAQALEALTHEIEWSVLDSGHGFTVTFLPDEGRT